MQITLYDRSQKFFDFVRACRKRLNVKFIVNSVKFVSLNEKDKEFASFFELIRAFLISLHVMIHYSLKFSVGIGRSTYLV